MRTRNPNRSKIKETVIRIRVTKSEALKFKEKAKEYNCDSVSEYVRMKCLNEDAIKEMKF